MRQKLQSIYALHIAAQPGLETKTPVASFTGYRIGSGTKVVKAFHYYRRRRKERKNEQNDKKN